MQQFEAEKLTHLTLTEDELIRHQHRTTAGQAELSEKDGMIYLRVISETALLNHEEH